VENTPKGFYGCVIVGVTGRAHSAVAVCLLALCHILELDCDHLSV